MNNTHPDPAEIAALDEDLLSEPEADALRDHLAGCASCAEIHADLLALREELRALPAPSIPDDVAARIDAALAAEAAAVSRETEEPEPAERETEQPTATPLPVPRPRWPRMALAAVGAIVAVGLGALLTQPFISQSTQQDGAASAEEADEDAAALATEPLEDQVRELLAETEDAPGTLSTMEGTEGGLADPSPESASGAEEPSEGAEDESGAVTPQEAEPVTDVPSCVEDAIGRQEAPLAAEEEDYGGVDAYLVVFRHTADPERVDAYVVDADCVSATPPASGEILVQQSYPLE
ncbi:hypothetical protein [Streptomyces sp. NPDC127098]|uniref:hypothetical protein n=1 Tax=Streptomyces sp. NPDC127098 TaxID=3347137 RepID=UPI00365EECEE